MNMNIAKGPRRCCACGEMKAICRTLATLNMKAPIPGTGWSCFVCHLPADGAIAVICDDCENDPDVQIQWAVVGFVGTSDKRILISELSGTHAHDAQYHPEMWVPELN